MKQIPLALTLSFFLAVESFALPFGGLAKLLSKASSKGVYRVAAPVGEEAARLVVDRKAARIAHQAISRQDPVLAAALRESLIAARRSEAALRLGGFTSAEVKCSIKLEAATLVREAEKEQARVAQISNDLVETAVKDLPDNFFLSETGSIKPSVDLSMQQAVTKHRAVMRERVTYDASAAQLEFEFASPSVTLQRATVDLGPRLNRYQAELTSDKIKALSRVLSDMERQTPGR